MPYQVSTLAQLKVTLAAQVDGSIFWTDEEARLALNEMLRDWNLLTGRWRRRLTLSTAAPVAGVPTVEYDLGATMTYGMRVRIGTNPGLIPTSIFELDLARPTWRAETITSGSDVPPRTIHWAPVSLRRIAIWPATATAGVNDLFVDGVANTPILVEDGDFVDLGEEIIDVLTDYALHLLAFKEGGARWAATQEAFVDFLQAAAEENGLLKASQAYRRYAGLDRRRDLDKRKDAPNKIAEIIQVDQGKGDSGGGGGG
jgi:hypothetical protein